MWGQGEWILILREGGVGLREGARQSDHLGRGSELKTASEVRNGVRRGSREGSEGSGAGLDRTQEALGHLR